MKNVVYIVIDALSKVVLDDYPFKDELFISKLAKKSIVFENVYSQAPFTEEATNAYLCGARTLDYSSTLFLYHKAPKAIHDFFKEKGYKTYYSSWKGNMVDDGYHEDANYPFLHELLLYRINEIKNRIKRGEKLEEYELQYIKAIIQKWLIDAHRFYVSYLNNDSRLNLHNNLLDKNSVEQALETIDRLIVKVGNRDFLLSFLTGDTLSMLPTIKTRPVFSNKEEAENLFTKYRKLFIDEQKKHVVKIGRFHAIKEGSQYTSKNIFSRFFRIVKWSVKYHDNSFCVDHMINKFNDVLNTDCLYNKGYFSCKNRVDDAIVFISKNKNSPFYLCIQPPDFHQSSSFHSYDINNLDLIRDELDDALKFAKKIPNEKKCFIPSFLSIRYIDKQIENLFNHVIKTGIMDKTLFVITSDHGYWDYYNKFPVFDDLNLMDETRMHVPLIVYNKNIKPFVSYKKINNYSIPNTILELCGFQSDKAFMPSVFNVPNDKYLIAEYFRGGSPDILHKNVFYTIHNEFYKLVVSVFILDEPEFKNCVAFYDLTRDRHENKNVVKKLKYKSVIDEMLLLACLRHHEVRNHLDGYYEHPSKWKEEIESFILEMTNI